MKTNYDKKQNVVFGIVLAASLIALASTTVKLIKTNNQKIDDKIQVVANNYDEIKKLVEKDKAEVLFQGEQDNTITKVSFDHNFLDYSQLYIMLWVDEGFVSDTFFTSSIYDEAYLNTGDEYGIAIVGSDRCASPSCFYSANIGIKYNSNSFELNILECCEVYVEPETNSVSYTDYLVDGICGFYSVIGII